MIRTVKDAARAALEVQNAVNLAAVLHAWAGVQSALIFDCASNASGAFRRHAVQVLFLSKISSLMTVATDCLGGVYAQATIDSGQDLFTEAYEQCKQLAEEAA